MKNEEMIRIGKEILDRVRNLLRERHYLSEEYFEEPAPHSPSFQESKGTSLSQVTRLNDYTWNRDCIILKMNMITEVEDEFMLNTIYLSKRQRDIVEAYIYALDYNQMLNVLNEKYYISTSTYKRESPKLRAILAQHIDIDSIPTLEDINDKVYKMMKTKK